MKVSKNFIAQEFVSKEAWNLYQKGVINIKWLINRDLVALAQFYKDFFREYYMSKDPEIKDVSIVINNWWWGGIYEERGFRMPDSKTGAKLSQHKFKDGFDCEVILIYKNGTRKEADPNEIRTIILKNETVFMEKGLTVLESSKYAPGWIHSDMRWTGMKHIFIVGK